jgi:hypothetical protein
VRGIGPDVHRGTTLPALSFSSTTSGAGLAALVPVLLVIAVIGGIVGSFVYAHRRKRAKEASLEQLLARHPGWMRVHTPCGLTSQALQDRTAATPRGDRRCGVRWGIGGPLTLPVGGQDTTCEASFFQWFSEERHTSRSSNGSTTTRYREVRETVGLVRLPVTCPPVRIGSESLFGRMGLTRGGEQVESSEFNRRFRVDGQDRTLTVQLLDANLQQELLERFQGRSIDLTADLLVLGGRPDHRDDSLRGVVGEFPAVRQDLERLIRQVPAQFWRAIGADRPDRPDRSGSAGPADRGA